MTEMWFKAHAPTGISTATNTGKSHSPVLDMSDIDVNQTQLHTTQVEADFNN